MKLIMVVYFLRFVTKWKLGFYYLKFSGGEENADCKMVFLHGTLKIYRTHINVK
jgi:hypothetical protein